MTVKIFNKLKALATASALFLLPPCALFAAIFIVRHPLSEFNFDGWQTPRGLWSKNLADIDPTRFLAWLKLIPFTVVWAYTGTWIRLFVKPAANWLRRASSWKHFLDEFCVRSVLAIAFTLIPFFFIQHEAGKYFPDLPGHDDFGIGLAYMCAAYTVTSLVIDAHEILVAVGERNKEC